MQLILCANFVACALAAIAVACAVASLLALLVGCGWALGATEAALACLTPALVTAPAALVVRAYCLSGARRRGRRAAEAFVRAGAPVISGCFAMALGLAPLLACQHEEARKFAIAISMLAACIGLWIGLFLPALLSAFGPEQARSSRRHSGSPQCCSGSAASGSRRVELRLGRPDGCGSDGGCATSPRLKRTRERLSRAFPPPPAASPSPRDVPFRAADRRPPPAAPRLEVVAAASVRARWPQVVPSRQRRPWPRARPSRSARDCLVRTRCSLAPPPSFRPRASRRPPRRGARICCYPAPRCWRACRRTQKHAARQQRLRATPASTEAVAMVGVGALRSRGRSRPNLLAPAAAPDGGRQARAAYR